MWWCLLDLVVSFLDGFQQSPHQPFLPSYIATNLELHRGETCLFWFCFSFLGVLQCFSLLCIMGPLAPILLQQSFQLHLSHFLWDEMTLLKEHLTKTKKPHFLLSFTVIFLVEKKTVTQVTGPEDLTLPSLLDSTNTIPLLPWWQKFSQASISMQGGRETSLMPTCQPIPLACSEPARIVGRTRICPQNKHPCTGSQSLLWIWLSINISVSRKEMHKIAT